MGRILRPKQWEEMAVLIVYGKLLGCRGLGARAIAVLGQGAKAGVGRSPCPRCLEKRPFAPGGQNLMALGHDLTVAEAAD